MSENNENIEYFSDPYDSQVEIILLNTCGFISSGREEMFQTINNLLNKKKRVCLIGCGVQYFEKVLKKEKVDNEIIKSELNIRNSIITNKDISYLSRNDLTLANLKSLTKRSQIFEDFCRYSAPRLLTNYENRYEYLKIAE